MARIRTIKPDFWEDESLALVSRDARLLFIATWNAADDEGLLRWTPAYVKSTAFIYDHDIDVNRCAELMRELEDAGLVFAYQGGKTNQQLAYVVKFHIHQRINRPSPPKLPPPSIQNRAVIAMYARRDGYVCHLCNEEIPDDPTAPEPLQPSLDHLEPRSKGGTDYPSNLAIAHVGCNKSRRDKSVESASQPKSVRSALDRVTDSVNHSVSQPVNGSRPEGKGKGGEREQGEGQPSPDGDSATLVDDALLQFEEHFWPAYPARHGKKNAKGKALTVWRTLTLEQRRRAVIGARNLARSDTLPKDAHRFLRRDTAGEFPFDDWQTPAVEPGATDPAVLDEKRRAGARNRGLALAAGGESRTEAIRLLKAEYEHDPQLADLALDAFEQTAGGTA